MRRGEQLRAALAVTGAVAGVAFASGRETALFFGQLGWAGWLAIPVAAAWFGLLSALLSRWAQKHGANGLPALRRAIPGGAGTAARLLHGLLLGEVGAMMLCGAGEIGALALPVRHGFAWGAAVALALAGFATLARLRPLPWAGLAALTLGMLFYAGLALDSRPARVFLQGEIDLALEGSLPAALLSALVFGSMNACVAAGTVVRFSQPSARPWRLGALCGGFMGAALLCANAAAARGGRLLLAQTLPTVLLAARWGLAGFWINCAFGFLCAASTLSAAVDGLIGR